MSEVFNGLLEANDKLRKRVYRFVVESKEEEYLKQAKNGQPVNPPAPVKKIDQNQGSVLDQAAPGDVVEPSNSENVTDDGQPTQKIVGDDGALHDLDSEESQEEAPSLEDPQPISNEVAPGIEKTSDGKVRFSQNLLNQVVNVIDQENVAQRAASNANPFASSYFDKNADFFKQEFDSIPDLFKKIYDDPEIYDYLSLAMNDTLNVQYRREGFKKVYDFAKISTTLKEVLSPQEQEYHQEYLNAIEDVSRILNSYDSNNPEASKLKVQDFSEYVERNQDIAAPLADGYVKTFFPEEYDSFQKNTNKEFYGNILASLLDSDVSVGIGEPDITLEPEEVKSVTKTIISNRELIFAEKTNEDDVYFSNEGVRAAYNKFVGSSEEDNVLGKRFRIPLPNGKDIYLFTDYINPKFEEDGKISKVFKGLKPDLPNIVYNDDFAVNNPYSYYSPHSYDRKNSTLFNFFEEVINNISVHPRLFANPDLEEAHGGLFLPKLVEYFHQFDKFQDEINTSQLVVEDDKNFKGFSLTFERANNASQLLDLLGFNKESVDVYASENSNKWKQTLHYFNKLIEVTGDLNHFNIKKLPLDPTYTLYCHKVNGNTVCRLPSVEENIDTFESSMGVDEKSITSLNNFFSNPKIFDSENNIKEEYQETLKEVINDLNPDIPGHILHKAFKENRITKEYMVSLAMFFKVNEEGESLVEQKIRDLLLKRQLFKPHPDVENDSFNLDYANILATDYVEGELKSKLFMFKDFVDYWSDLPKDKVHFSVIPDEDIVIMEDNKGNQINLHIGINEKGSIYITPDFPDLESVYGDSEDVSFSSFKDEEISIDIPLNMEDDPKSVPNYELTTNYLDRDEVADIAIEIFGKEELQKKETLVEILQKGKDAPVIFNKMKYDEQLAKDLYAISQETMKRRGFPEEFVVFRAGHQKFGESYVGTSINYFTSLRFLYKLKEKAFEEYANAADRTSKTAKGGQENDILSPLMNEVNFHTLLQAYKVKRKDVLVDASNFTKFLYAYEDEIMVHSSKLGEPIKLNIPKEHEIHPETTNTKTQVDKYRDLEKYPEGDGKAKRSEAFFKATDKIGNMDGVKRLYKSINDKMVFNISQALKEGNSLKGNKELFSTLLNVLGAKSSFNKIPEDEQDTIAKGIMYRLSKKHEEIVSSNPNSPGIVNKLVALNFLKLFKYYSYKFNTDSGAVKSLLNSDLDYLAKAVP
jgi:hypothetical protein